MLAGDKVPEELIVVDNASSDDTVEMLAREFPQVRVIANRENLMASKAVNQGIAAATGEFVFASADDNVVDRACVRELYDAMAVASGRGAGERRSCTFTTPPIGFGMRVAT